MHGPTLALKSLTKPDYTKVSCGTVVNQVHKEYVHGSGEKEETA